MSRKFWGTNLFIRLLDSLRRILTMRAPTERRVFAPGDGAEPPELAGRSTQQAVLLRCLADLVDKSAPPHNVVLVGPRGNGKTVLLNWFESACAKASSIEVLALTPRDIPTQRALIDALLPQRRLAKLASRLPREVGRYGLKPRGRQRPLGRRL